MNRRNHLVRVAAAAGLLSSLTAPVTAVAHGFAHAGAFVPTHHSVDHGDHSHSVARAHADEEPDHGASDDSGPGLRDAGPRDHDHPRLDLGSVQKSAKLLASPERVALAIPLDPPARAPKPPHAEEVRTRDPPGSPPPRLRAPPHDIPVA